MIVNILYLNVFSQDHLCIPQSLGIVFSSISKES